MNLTYVTVRRVAVAMCMLVTGGVAPVHARLELSHARLELPHSHSVSRALPFIKTGAGVAGVLVGYETCRFFVKRMAKRAIRSCLGIKNEPKKQMSVAAVLALAGAVYLVAVPLARLVYRGIAGTGPEAKPGMDKIQTVLEGYLKAWIMLRIVKIYIDQMTRNLAAQIADREMNERVVQGEGQEAEWRKAERLRVSARQLGGRCAAILGEHQSVLDRCLEKVQSALSRGAQDSACMYAVLSKPGGEAFFSGTFAMTEGLWHMSYDQKRMEAYIEACGAHLKTYKERLAGSCGLSMA